METTLIHRHHPDKIKKSPKAEIEATERCYGEIDPQETKIISDMIAQDGISKEEVMRFLGEMDDIIGGPDATAEDYDIQRLLTNYLLETETFPLTDEDHRTLRNLKGSKIMLKNRQHAESAYDARVIAREEELNGEFVRQHFVDAPHDPDARPMLTTMRPQSTRALRTNAKAAPEVILAA